MAVDQSLDLLVDRIYAAALRPEMWGEVVSEVGVRIGATSGTSLWFGNNGLELVRAEIWNIDPDALAEYQKHYLAFCPRYRASRELEVGAVYDDRQTRSREDGKARDYYAFVDRYNLGLARIALAEKRPSLTIGMNFYNRTKEGLSDDGEAVLGFLSPHFRRACNLTQALGDLADRATLGDAWFHARTASLTLDAEGNVARINATAEGILKLADGLSVVNGRLMAAAPKDRAKLEAEIARGVGNKLSEQQSSGDFILISRPSGLPAFALSIVPMTLGGSREKAIATIAPTVPDITPRSLQRAFGLTHSEACIAAALSGGRSPEQIAADRLVSLSTIRSQMKAIYNRLDVGSQLELVSRITAAALGVRL